MKKYPAIKLCLATILLIVCNMAVSASKPAPIGHVLELSGLSQVLRNNDKYPLKKGSRLQKSDRLLTDRDSRLRFRLVDGSIITLGENSEFDLVSYQFDPKVRANNKAEFKLTNGVFRFISGLITKQDNPDLQVITPVATIGIRGTDFWGGFLEPGALDVLLIKSDHQLTVSNDLGVVTLDKDGSGTTVHENSPPGKPRAWPDAKVERALSTIMMN